MWRDARPEDDETVIALCRALYEEDPASKPVPDEHHRRTLRELRAAPARGRVVVLEEKAVIEERSEVTVGRHLPSADSPPSPAGVGMPSRSGATHVIGYAILVACWSNELGGEVLIVDELYVTREHRSRGHARSLIEALTRGDGPWPSKPVALELEVTPDNARARALYERLGFEPKRNAVLRALLS